LVLEAQTLRYYLKIFNFFLFIIIIYIFYVFTVKDIVIKNDVITIKKNQNIDSILENNLKKENLVNKILFKTYLTIYNRFYKHIHYGNFFYDEGNNFIKFINTITSPSNLIVKITIVEGWSKNNLDKILKLKFNSSKTIEYEELIADTYFVNSDNDFINFKKKLTIFKNKFFEKYLEHPFLKEFTINELLIIGSLIEKEGLDYLDKKNISSVILNRLNKKMKLQIDATVIFAITDGQYGLDRDLTYNDLDFEHPYNTYHIYGLPPKPISYVGSKTIELILENYKTDFLFYFYNNNEKKHIFSETYSEHRRKLNEYRSKK